MNYVTCNGCTVDKSTCERRAEISEAIRGAGLTSARFKCSDRASMFVPGERVYAELLFRDEDGDTAINFRATVLRENPKKGGRFLLFIDPGPSMDEDYSGMIAPGCLTSKSLLVSILASRIFRINEPSKAVCPTCFFVEGLGESDRCYKGKYFTGPKGCLSPKDQENTQL